MKVAIVGLGVAGAYLANLLAEKGVEATIYEAQERYDKPCGCGFIEEAVRRHPWIDEYRLTRTYSYVVVHTVHGSARLASPRYFFIDKHRMVDDLRRRAEKNHYVVYERADPYRLQGYDLVVDARGPYAHLGSKHLVPLVAGYAKGRAECAHAILSLRGRGYAWFFPYKPGVLNVGYGALGDRRPLRELRKLFPDARGVRGAPLWLGGPVKPYELRAGKVIVRVGEAAGLVDPLIGEGIRQALDSAKALASAISRARKPLEALYEYLSSSLLRRWLVKLRLKKRLVESLAKDMRVLHALHWFVPRVL